MSEEAAADEREEALADLLEQYHQRVKAGEHLLPARFADEHPDFRAELLPLLSAFTAVDGAGKTAPIVADDELQYPECLGGYRLIEKIGRGGMGTVFRAEQESLQREVAIKILSPSWNSDETHREAFENESRLIAGLRHTNIVEVYGAGQEAGYRYYVMSLVHGRGLCVDDLRTVYGPIPIAQAVAKAALQAAKALAFAHEHGVIHRDIKPGNLLLDKSGTVHVSDFGLATILNAGEAAPLVTQSNDGTLRYMAPERLLRGESNFASDQYSLGLTLYELLQNKPAFEQSAPGQLVRQICDSPLEPLRDAGELGAIINKSISYTPQDRYASMHDMARDLQRFLQGVPVKARPASHLRRYVMWVKRRPAVALWSHAAGLLVVLLFLSISIGYVVQNRALKGENVQRVLAERNAHVADLAMQRILSSILGADAATSDDDENMSHFVPTKADAQLIEDLLPYYEEIAAQAEASDAKLARASRILATIALQTGDYTTAEEHYEKAAIYYADDAVRVAQCKNGQALAMSMQRSDKKNRQAKSLLQDSLQELDEASSLELNLEGLRSLILWARMNHVSRPTHRGLPPEEMHRQKFMGRAVELLLPMLAEQPDDTNCLMVQAELLASPALARRWRTQLAPQGETSLDILERVLEAEPQHEEALRLYLRLCLRPNAGEQDYAASIARAELLLSLRPCDSEALFFYMTLRGRYSALLEAQGEDIQALIENERTLGMLSFLTNKSDFSEEMREQLIMMVAFRPAGAENRSQQEKELRLLMQNFDNERAQQLRDNIQRIRYQIRPPMGPRPRQGQGQGQQRGRPHAAWGRPE